MSKRTITALCALCLLAPFAVSQAVPYDANIGVATDSTGKVSIASKGRDVRDVLYDLFTQGKRNFVVQGEVHANLYLSLQGVTFDQALGIVLRQTKLEYRVKDGVTYIAKDFPADEPSSQQTGEDAKVTDAQSAATSKTTSAAPASSKVDLSKKVSVKESKIALRDLIKTFSNQTGIDIVVAHDVKDYRMDVNLQNKTLKYALEVIAKGARLQFYVRDSGDVLVENKVG